VVNPYAHRKTCKARNRQGTTDEDESPVKGGKPSKEKLVQATESITSEDDMISKFHGWMNSLKGGFAR
tara:strand:+ start:239 stop:442 length:204 start_codon:yes stop_codon:yes gene_type:complete